MFVDKLKQSILLIIYEKNGLNEGTIKKVIECRSLPEI